MDGNYFVGMVGLFLTVFVGSSGTKYVSSINYH
jgi:hypothetical protein